MKKKLSAIAMTALLLTGCGSSAPNASAPAESAQAASPAAASTDSVSFKTMGDIFAANPEEKERGNTEDTYFLVFELNGTLYRAYADLPTDVFDQLMNLEFDDPDYEKKHHEIAGPLEIRQFDNLTEKIPPQSELDQWVGKTGQDLKDDGWTEGYGFDLTEMNFYLYKGPFCYKVKFKKDKEYENSDDFDVWSTISPLTIESVTYDGIGNGSEI